MNKYLMSLLMLWWSIVNCIRTFIRFLYIPVFVNLCLQYSFYSCLLYRALWDIIYLNDLYLIDKPRHDGTSFTFLRWVIQCTVSFRPILLVLKRIITPVSWSYNRYNVITVTQVVEGTLLISLSKVSWKFRGITYWHRIIVSCKFSS